jgi:hypothetical protein
MHLRWVAVVAGDHLADSEHLPVLGSRPAAQAGAGHGDVAEILRGGDHELMRGTAKARRHRAAG